MTVYTRASLAASALTLAFGLPGCFGEKVPEVSPPTADFTQNPEPKGEDKPAAPVAMPEPMIVPSPVPKLPDAGKVGMPKVDEAVPEPAGPANKEDRPR